MRSNTIDPLVQKEILMRLHMAEQEHGVKILYACESGSRAWGFESPDSDYDVRFIYCHDEDWYLSFNVESQRDVIEYPIVDDIDCSGWDLKKALYLFTRTNGALFEWLNSPIKYIENGVFAETLRKIAPQALNDTALCYHYSHMARRNAREYLFDNQVKLKKYFYVLRPLLAIRYIQNYRQPPPVEFEKLLAKVAPSDLVSIINDLIILKKQTPEIGLGEPIPELNQFIEQELARHGETFKGQGRPDIMNKSDIYTSLNDTFRSVIRVNSR